MCGLHASFSQLSCLLPSPVQLSGPFSGSGVQTEGLASGPGSPLGRAHPHSHSRAGKVHAQSLSAGAPRFRGIPSMLRGFSKSVRLGNKERSFSNHFPEIFHLICPSNHLALNRNDRVHARAEGWAGLAIPRPGP